MTLREQIKEIHAAYFNVEFHKYRGDLLPQMVNDLCEKMFDQLELGPTEWVNGEKVQYWAFADCKDIRAVKEARRLLKTMDLRENTPAVE